MNPSEGLPSEALKGPGGGCEISRVTGPRRAPQLRVNASFPRSKTRRKPRSMQIDLPQPPPHLSPSAKQWWQLTIEAYVLQEHHLRLLQLACEAWDRAGSPSAARPRRVDRAGPRRRHPPSAARRFCDGDFPARATDAGGTCRAGESGCREMVGNYEGARDQGGVSRNDHARPKRLQFTTFTTS